MSETSRQLYIHRNTLVYRLDKLQKSTGLDIRVFEDAITFKIALMVVKYMRDMDRKEKQNGSRHMVMQTTEVRHRSGQVRQENIRRREDRHRRNMT